MKTSQLARRWEWFVIACVLALAWALPMVALGQECTTDKDCPEGMVCLPVPCAACDPDGACEPCPETRECVEKGGAGEWYGGMACDSDQDCPYGFRCEEMEVPCGGGVDCKPCTCACPADGECPPCECPECPDPEPCVPEVQKVCAYYPKECGTDTDCDAGFECRPIEECTGFGCACPGCACSPCAPDEECPPCDCPDAVCDCPEAYEEHCEVIGSWCAPKEQPCESDGDCLEGWECVEEPVPCMCPACDCPEVFCAPDEACPDIGECVCPPCDCAGDGKKICVPKGWRDLGYTSDAKDPETAFSGVRKSGGEPGPTGPESGSNGDATPAPAASQTSSGSSSGCVASTGVFHGVAASFLMTIVLTLPALARIRRRRAEG